jgi:major membrane immunogen (membrane-anchored lipoprotein)
MKKSFLAVAGLTVLAVSQTAAAEGFRCGQKIATPDMTVEELLEACGEPTDKTMKVVDVHGPNAQGTGNIKRGTITVETWTFDRGSQASAMVVTIEDGKIKKMERAESK